MINDLFGILCVNVIKHVTSCEYLEYEHCKCRKQLVDKSVIEWTETIEEVKLAKITLAESENNYKCSSCTEYTVLFWIFSTINVVGIGAYFVFYNWSLIKNNVSCIKFGIRKKQRFGKHRNGRNQTNKY